MDSEFATESEALRCFAAFEAAVSDAPLADAAAAAAKLREFARLVSRNEALRKKLGIIPALFPLVARLFATLRDSITSVFTVDPQASCSDSSSGSVGQCGYSSWKAASSASELTTAAFHFVRNLCAAVPENQILACQSGCYKTLEEIMSHLGLWLQTNKYNSCPDIKAVAYTCIQMGIQCLANMMTSNPIVQNKIWPRFFGDNTLLITLLDTSDPKTVKYVLLCVYNCIFNDSKRSSLIIQTPLGRKLLFKILTQIDSEQPHQQQESTSSSSETDNFDIIYAIFKTLTTSLQPSHVFKSLCLLDKETAPTDTNDSKKIYLNTLNRAHVVFLKLVDGDMSAQSTGTLLWGDSYLKTVISLMAVLVSSLERFSNAISSLKSSASTATTDDSMDVDGAASSSSTSIDGIGSDLEGLVLLLAYFSRILGGAEQVSREAAVTAVTDPCTCWSSALRPPTLDNAGITEELAMNVRRKWITSLGLIDSIVKLLVVAGKIQPPLVGGIGKTYGTAAAATASPKIQEVKDEKTEQLVQVVTKGLYMMKGDSIKVISNVSFMCKEAQDQVRLVGGIPVVLSHCIIDDSNPFVKEWAVFAIRNLCDGNKENQTLIESMEAVGLPEGQNEGFAAHGVRAGLSADGRVRITPVDAE
ncbi:spinocerebellar ataxia type 10 protein domain-containing protein [Obelidium mucronatum]|nr:spinocerebellar ataxia type 10 protein domain-containing protein [Obelidium mucronatum]